MQGMLTGVGAGDLELQALQYHISRLLLFLQPVFALRNELDNGLTLCVSNKRIRCLDYRQRQFSVRIRFDVGRLGQILHRVSGAIGSVRKQCKRNRFAVLREQLEGDPLQRHA